MSTDDSAHRNGLSDPAGLTDALVRAEERRLFGLAYRMLGSVTEAEDAVQEAFLRWTRDDRGDVDEPSAWLTTVVTRICLDRLGSAQRRRETYVGEWLPEPIATDPDPEALVGTAESLTLAFLVVLESLSPLERAAFLLHDVFGHDFNAVARTLDRSPAAVRKLASRARQHVSERTAREQADHDQAQQVANAFLAACAGGDVDQVLSLLAPDVVFVSDGGGLASAVPEPLAGADRVGRVLMGFWSFGVRRGMATETVEVNGEPGLWVREGDRTVTVMAVEVTDGRISAVRAVRNPEKLGTFGR